LLLDSHDRVRQIGLPRDYNPGLLLKTLALHASLTQYDIWRVLLNYLLISFVVYEMFWLYFAAARSATINELNQPWRYKYLYKLHKFHNNIYYDHLNFSFAEKLKNLLTFALCCKKKHKIAAKVQAKKRKGEEYIELATISSSRDL